MPDRLPSLILLVGHWILPAAAGWVAVGIAHRSTPHIRAILKYAVLPIGVGAWAAAWFRFQLHRMPPYISGATQDPTYAPTEAVAGLALVAGAVVLPLSALACALAFRIRGRSLARALVGIVLVAASLLSLATLARAQSSSAARDTFARIIDRSDAVILGRVLDAGWHWIGDSTAGRSEAYARIAVERWIVGSDTDSVVEVKLGHGTGTARFLEGPADRRVICYLLLSLGKWWLKTDLGWRPNRPVVGLEVLSPSAALDRIPAIRKSARASSPESLAVRADLAVVGALETFTDKPGGMTCHVDRLIFGTPSSAALTVVPHTPEDMRLGPALLLLKQQPDSTWEPLNDGAGCIYLDQDRPAHLTVPAETLYARVAAAHARVGRAQR